MVTLPHSMKSGQKNESRPVKLKSKKFVSTENVKKKKLHKCVKRQQGKDRKFVYTTSCLINWFVPLKHSHSSSKQAGREGENDSRPVKLNSNRFCVYKEY